MARKAKVHQGVERRLQFEILESRCLFAVSVPLLNSWFLAGQNQFAQVISGYNVAAGPSTTWPTNVPVGATYNGGNATPALGDISKVSSSTNYVYVNTTDFSSYVMGPWFNAMGQTFMNFPTNQNALYRIRDGVYPSATHGTAGNGAVGILVNGGSVFNNGDAFTYTNATGADANPGDRIWFRRAQFAEAVTFDHARAHQPAQGQAHNHVNPTALRAQLNDNIDYIGTTNFFPYDPDAALHLGEGADKSYRERTTNLHHSPILGWAFDGFPIYGPYGYSNPNDSNSPIQRIESSFTLRTVSNRTTLPGWAAQISFPTSGVALDGVYSLAANQYGPAINAANPLGKYGEDYQFVVGLSTLDQYNGRFTKTPEFPNGTYAYFLPIDAAGTPAFPDFIGRQFYGAVNSGRVNNTNGDGAVTVQFDIANNTAPVVNGPNVASIAVGGTLNFTSGNKISVTDIDAATTERVALSVTGGMLNVDLSGPLAGGSTIIVGANNSAALTLSGGISQLNAALATLTFTAPISGSSVTLTAQANDGSPLNNLSNSLSTTITLVASSVVNRQVFYNRSPSTAFGDGSGNPINAIDTSKSVLLPGQTSSFNSYSNYTKGLNGLIVDVANLAEIPSSADFQFAIWNGFDAVGFLPLASQATISTFAGGGTSGASRVKIEFADNAIRNTWLRVTLLANANTGLLATSVFYFGNAVGDVDIGNVGTPVTISTNSSDYAAVRQNLSPSSSSVGVDNIHDINKDGVVNPIDMALVRQNELNRILGAFTAPVSLQHSLVMTSTTTTDATSHAISTTSSAMTTAMSVPNLVAPVLSIEYPIFAMAFRRMDVDSIPSLIIERLAMHRNQSSRRRIELGNARQARSVSMRIETQFPGRINENVDKVFADLG